MNRLGLYSKLTKSYQSEKNFCGCCGTEISTYDCWCIRCHGHTDNRSVKPPWKRTFFAIHNVHCPFEVGLLEKTKSEKES